MRGGSIPMLVWGTFLLVLYIINWIWDARLIAVGPTVFAIVVIYGLGVVMWLRRRDAVRRGPPALETEPEALASSSMGAALVGVAVSSILFGVVWAHFLIYFGAGLLVASLARTGLEVRDQRAARAAARRELRR